MVAQTNSNGNADKRLRTARFVASVFAFALVGLSAWLEVRGWDAKWPTHFTLCNAKVQEAIVWSVWTIGSPLWFLLEFYLYDYKPETFEQFKYGQDLAAKVWIAVATVFFALYFAKELRAF